MKRSGLYDHQIMEHAHAGSPNEGTPLFLVFWEHRRGAKLVMEVYAPCHLAHTLSTNPRWTSSVIEFLEEISVYLRDVNRMSRAYFLSLSGKTSGDVRSLVCGSCLGAELECVIETFFMVRWPRDFERLPANVKSAKFQVIPAFVAPHKASGEIPLVQKNLL